MKPSIIFETQEKGLDNDSLVRIWDLMSNGCLCILPSDSAYILTGDLRVKGVSNDIDRILNRKKLKMSLAFNTIDQINSSIKLTNLAYRFIRSLTPGGVTFIVDPVDQEFVSFSKLRLNADGSIGLRISNSEIERQIASFFPIPTTPIRDNNENLVLDANSAWEIVNNRMLAYSIKRSVILINGDVTYPGELSTVIKEKKVEGLYRLEILRQGRVSNELITARARECSYENVVIRTKVEP